MRDDARDFNHVPRLVANPSAARIAGHAADYLERMDAMFYAIVQESDEHTYLRSLAELGQSVASGYSADMRQYQDMYEGAANALQP